MDRQRLNTIYATCRARIGPEAWAEAVESCAGGLSVGEIPESLAQTAPWLPDLALLEWTRHAVEQTPLEAPTDLDAHALNPTLEILPLSWRLTILLSSPDAAPEEGDEWALIWREPASGEVRVEAGTDENLLAVKMVAENLAPEEVAKGGGIAGVALVDMLQRAAEKGLVLAPRSKLRRETTQFSPDVDIPQEFLAADGFTLQWHITNTCDLHCRHCYDRTKRSPLTLAQGLGVLDDLRAFCADRHVRGHVCLTGGNPLLSPHFLDLYRGAAERAFALSVLGNPCAREPLDAMLAIQPPRYFQVSLEGLREHNDYIRGDGHFDRTMAFLALLREVDISSAVMLTLTRDNIDQVLPLAEALRDRTDYFTFNRLSPVGEGADLLLPSAERYTAFLRDYVDASKANPVLGLKDNLINCVLEERGEEPFGGCTGYGCGAAFSFLAVLPGGEAHACRKFPSPVGNVLESTIAEVYDSEEAARYRRGTSACQGCRLRHVCGGCLAVTSGLGLGPFADRDPHCPLERSV